MLREDDSRRKPWKELCFSLLAIAVGFASCWLMTLLAYLTYQAAVGNRSFCNLWTDIPGRFMILITSYYGAGVCGILPIPERYRINCLPQPFLLYKLESWKRLFRNLCLLFAFDCEPYEFIESDPETSPSRNESNEFFYDYYSPDNREQSDKIPGAEVIHTPEKHPVRKDARDRYREYANYTEEMSMSFDSPIGGHIVPMVKGRSSKPRYLPDSSLSTTTESSGKSNAQTEILHELSGTLKERAKAVVDTQDETPSTFDLPIYPRFPWGFLRLRGTVPQEAKALHKKHLMMENRELFKRDKQKAEDKKSKHDSTTNNDETNNLIRLPLRSKTSNRVRTRSIPYSVPKLRELSFRERTFSMVAPHETPPSAKHSLKPEDNSSKIDEKVEGSQETLMRCGSSFQDGNEASTSGQNDASPNINDMPDTDDESTETLNRAKFSKRSDK